MDFPSLAPIVRCVMDAPTQTATSRPASRPRGRRPARRWLPYAGLIALIALIVIGLWPRPVAVEMVKASMGSLRTTVNEEGKTRIRQRFTVAAPVIGQLRRIPFKAGAAVIAHETVLAAIDPAPAPVLDPRARALAEAARDTAKANLDRARSAHLFALSDLRRAEKLSSERTISPQELESVQWRETATAKDLSAAESALRQAEAELMDGGPGNTNVSRDPVILRSPASGRVLRVFEESARIVVAGTPLIELGDPADLEVLVEVLSRDGAAILPGTSVELDQWGGPDPLQARVRHVEPAAFTKVSALGVEEQRVNVVADILTPLDKRRHIGDNFRVEARILTWETNRTLKVPSGAIFRRENGYAAFVVRDGRAHLQALEAGHSSGVETEILSGLKEGDNLIVYPGDRISDGTRVRALQIGK